MALAAAGLRAGARLAPDGLARVLCAAPLAVGAAVGEALALGLFGLGGSAAALTAAAVLTWLVVRVVVRERPPRVTSELAAWWRARSWSERALLGALGGAGLAWAAWQLRHPVFGFDSETYHLPEIILWVQGGHPGMVEDVLPGIPVGSYPLTNEVTVAWATGIARSFVPFLLWPWLTLALTACASWAGLRELRVPPIARALAVAALCSSPWLLAWRSHGAMGDPGALAWLVCAAALFALARKRPALLAPAVLAAGLAIGVKTTTIPLTLLVATLGLWGSRRELRSVRAPLFLAFAGAIAVGGVWYLRNLVRHGSPIWPFVTAPWGDPSPHFIALAKTSFLDRPAATVARFHDAYLGRFGGGVALLAGGLLAPLLSRQRRVLAAAAAAALGLLIWMSAPVTGIPPIRALDESVFSTTRYLLPVTAAGALALALAAAGRRRLSILANALLLVALVVNLAQTFDLGFPSSPRPWVPLLGGVVGALAGGLFARVPRRALPRFAIPLVAVVLGAGLAAPADNFAARYAAQRSPETSALTSRLATDPRFRSTANTVASAPIFIPVLAGDRLERPFEALPRSGPCAAIVVRERTQWLVVYRRPLLSAVVPLAVHKCLPGLRPALEDRYFTVYPPLMRQPR